MIYHEIGLVFDLDGTICYPSVPFEEVFELYFKVPFTSVSEIWIKQIYDHPLALGSEIIKNTFPYKSVNECADDAINFGFAWANVHKIFPGFISTLDLIKESGCKKIGIITNGPFDFQQAVINFLNLQNHLPTIIISGDKSVGIRKPNLGIYKKMEERLEIYGSNLIMIGDSYENDVCGALNAGWKSIWIQPSNTIDTKIQKLSLMEFISKASSSSGAPLSISWECINK